MPLELLRARVCGSPHRGGSAVGVAGGGAHRRRASQRIGHRGRGQGVRRLAG
jgi:hypothetical protein